MNNLIITVSNRRPTEWYFLYDEFYRSLEGSQCMVIDYKENWGGLLTKSKWLYRAIRDGYINSELIAFVDSWDMIFTCPPEELFEKYKAFDADIVVSTERNCFPPDLKDEFDKIKAPTDYKYLNSGLVIGKTESIKKCFESVDILSMPDDHFDPVLQRNIHPEDQTLWQNLFLKQEANIKLDYYQQLCQTLHDATIDEFDLTEERIKNKITNSYPCILHFNGGAKSNMELREPILKHLNLL